MYKRKPASERNTPSRQSGAVMIVFGLSLAILIGFLADAADTRVTVNALVLQRMMSSAATVV